MSELTTSKCNLENVYPVDKDKLGVLFHLLGEREPYQIISHTRMPTFTEHESFVWSKPYKEWYILRSFKLINNPIGSYYITFKNEIGIHIAKGYRGNGLGKAVIDHILEKYPQESFLANINPQNEASIKLFESKKFKHIQNTYRFDPCPSS